MRKVLSFVLVLSLVLGSFSMAFAATPASTGLSDIDGIANEEAIQVNFDLGIVTGNPDGTFLPEKTVTRAEFAAMITRALAIPDSALAGYTATTFKDTTGYGWAVPYLAFCQSKGILLGDGAGNVMPGRTINTNEAVTMVLRAIGYTSNSSDLVGAWPANYVTKAQDLGIYKDVAASVNVDKANAAQFIYNALTITKVQVATDGTTTNMTGNPTMLTAGLDCTPDLDTTIDGTEASLININKYLGVKGDAYLNDDDEIVAFKAESTQITGKMDEDGRTFTATVDDTEYTSTTGIDLANVAVEIYNGKTENIGAGAYTTSDAIEYVINVDLAGKKITRIYSVVQWEVTAGDVVSASDVADITSDKSLLSYKFKQDDDKNIDLDTFALTGVASLDKIEKDNVVYVYADSANKITKIEVGTETAEGVIANYKSGSATKYAIGAKTYKNATDYVNGVADNTDADTVVANDVTNEVKVKLDARGYVYDVEDLSGGASNIAVIIKQADGISDQVKMLKADGTSSTHTYDAAKLHVGDGVASKGAVIGYGLNKDGKITSTNETHTTPGANLIFKSNSVVNVGGVDKIIKSNVVVFTYDAFDDEFDVSSIDKIEKNVAAVSGCALYDAGKVVGLMVPVAAAKASADDVYAVVNDLYVDNTDGDKVDRIVGLADGKPIDKKADGQYFSGGNQLVAPTKATPAALNVQLFKIDMDANGIITDVNLVVANATKKIAIENAVELTAADGRNSVSYTSGSAVIAPLSKDVVVYELNDDGEYVAYTGTFKAQDVVVLYELDDDADGYDLVFVTRAYR